MVERPVVYRSQRHFEVEAHVSSTVLDLTVKELGWSVSELVQVAFDTLGIPAVPSHREAGPDLPHEQLVQHLP
jgi:hypothetical protein